MADATEPAGSPNARPQAASSQIGRKLNTVIIAVLVLAVALLGWRLLVVRQGAGTAPKPVAAAQAQTAGNTEATVVHPAAATPAVFNPPRRHPGRIAVRQRKR